MTHDAGAEIAIDWFVVSQMRNFRCELAPYGFDLLVQGRTVADGDVVDLVGRVRMLIGGSKQIGLNDVVDVAEVATGFAVAVDVHRFVPDHARHPLRYHGRVGTLRIL